MVVTHIANRWLESLLGRIEKGTLTLVFPDARRLRFGGRVPGPRAEINIRRNRFFRKVMLGGDVGFAEAYMDGDCDCDDLTAIVRLVIENSRHLEGSLYGNLTIRLLNRIQHMRRPNTPSGAKRNIAAHYDLGNEFYSAWLDDTMTYSAAVFERPDMSIDEAQRTKYRRIADLAAAGPGKRILEIGCGWGGFAEFVAKERGAEVTALTISPAQYEFASKRIFNEGLAEKVKIKQTDYREIEGRFDGIASIEMFEAVGERYWPAFFSTLHERLEPGGRAALQIITIADAAFGAYRRGTDFIQKYVFPGGLLPSIGKLKEQTAVANLTWLASEGIGEHYAHTLAIWHKHFDAAWPKLAAMDFDERFRRMWKYYLAYCEAGFATGRIDVRQIALARS